jgi:hypothetical protein
MTVRQKQRMHSFLIILASLIATVAARVSNCGGSLTVTHMSIDPPGIVAANQTVRARFDVIVPDTLRIEDSNLSISTSWFGLSAATYTNPLCDFIGCPVARGSIGVEHSAVFPDGVFGHVTSRFNLKGVDGADLLCIDWTAYATGSATNETNWMLRRMYA